MRKALVIAFLIGLSGCLDYDEVLSLEADGSGTVRVDFTADLTFSETLNKLAAPPGEKPSEDNPYKEMVSKQEILKYVQGVDGVTVKQCLCEDLGANKTHVKLLVEFKSLDALRKTAGFSCRELKFEAKDDQVVGTYQIDARFLKELSLLPGPDDPQPQTDLEKKMRKAVEDATADASAKITVNFPAKPTGKDDKAVRIEVPKKDPKAHAAVAKEPLVLTANFAKKDVEALLKKEENPPAKKDGAAKKDGE